MSAGRRPCGAGGWGHLSAKPFICHASGLISAKSALICVKLSQTTACAWPTPSRYGLIPLRNALIPLKTALINTKYESEFAKRASFPRDLSPSAARMSPSVDRMDERPGGQNQHSLAVKLDPTPMPPGFTLAPRFPAAFQPVEAQLRPATAFPGLRTSERARYRVVS